MSHLSDWIEVTDSVSGKIYYANMKTRETSWTLPTINQNNSTPKWRKAHDPNTDKDYWYHIDTKETTWIMPNEVFTEAKQYKILLNKHEIFATINQRYASIIYSFDFENISETSNELQFPITIDSDAF
eukprot:133855_1